MASSRYGFKYFTLNKRLCAAKRITRIIPETVGQFIGLKDKNGKEIFEGDILDFNGITVEVRGVFAFLVNGNLDGELYGNCRTDLFAKVIGNIYETS